MYFSSVPLNGWGANDMNLRWYLILLSRFLRDFWDSVIPCGLIRTCYYTTLSLTENFINISSLKKNLKSECDWRLSHLHLHYDIRVKQKPMWLLRGCYQQPRLQL